MRSISRQLELPLGAERTFALLHTPNAIRGWWSAARVIVAARPGGLWVAAWGDDEDAPDYITAARIVVWEPPRQLRLGEFEYFTRDGAGLPFRAALETEFSVQPVAGGSILRVQQTGSQTRRSLTRSSLRASRGGPQRSRVSDAMSAAEPREQQPAGGAAFVVRCGSWR